MRSQLHLKQTNTRGLLSNGARAGAAWIQRIDGDNVTFMRIMLTGYFNTGDTIVINWKKVGVAQAAITYTVAAGSDRYYDFNKAAVALAARITAVASADLTPSVPATTGVVKILGVGAGAKTLTTVVYTRTTTVPPPI